MTEADSRFPAQPSHERPTSARLSFASSQLARSINLEDYIVGTSAQQSRLIRYQGGAHVGLREKMQTAGLLLGQQIDGDNVYRIPRSSRPLAYEASIRRDGSFSYGDEQLAYDLGSLLGTLSGLGGAESESWLVIDAPDAQDLGQMISIVDFTLPEEGNVFLIPGVEYATTAADKVLVPDPTVFYTRHLPEFFNGDIGRVDAYFCMGFNEQRMGGQKGDFA